LKKLFTALFALMLAASSAYANYTEFKAIAVEFIDGQKTENPIYVTPQKSRREFNGGKEIVVTRNDLKVTWFIYPQIRCYVQTANLGTVANFNMPDEKSDTGDLKRKFIGEEDREGFRMKKYLVTIKYSNMPGEDSYYEWTRNDFPVPVRTESLDGSYWTEYKKISRGPISPDLFKKPPYKQISAEDAERLLEEYNSRHGQKKSKRAQKSLSAKKKKETKSNNLPKPIESETEEPSD